MTKEIFTYSKSNNKTPAFLLVLILKEASVETMYINLMEFR